MLPPPILYDTMWSELLALYTIVLCDTWQGVRSIKQTDLLAVYVHIKPPSMDILEQRLRSRKTDTEEAICRRLETAKGELEAGKQGSDQSVCCGLSIEMVGCLQMLLSYS